MNETGFSKLVKETDSGRSIRLTGPQKAAILFAELGKTVTDQMTASFTTKQLHLLRDTMKKLGPINVKAEIEVLEQALKYGTQKGLWDIKSAIKTDVARRSTTLRSAASSNPSAMAGLISSWLDTAENDEKKDHDGDKKEEE